jgi:Ulp1 family protease
MNAVTQFLPQQPQRWIFVPINQANYHWVLVVYDALERTLTG